METGAEQTLTRWANSDRGVYVHRLERELITRLVPSNIRRKRCVQLGFWGEQGDLLENTSNYAPRRYQLDWRIPLPAASAGLILLPPSLTDSPLSQREILDEVDRIACDGAWAVIIQFTPASHWQRRAWLPEVLRLETQRAMKIGLQRNQWQLLAQQRYLAWPAPFSKFAFWGEPLGRQLWPGLASATMTIACKQRLPLQPLGQRLLNRLLPPRTLVGARSSQCQNNLSHSDRNNDAGQ